MPEISNAGRTEGANGNRSCEGYAMAWSGRRHRRSLNFAGHRSRARNFTRRSPGWKVLNKSSAGVWNLRVPWKGLYLSSFLFCHHAVFSTCGDDCRPENAHAQVFPDGQMLGTTSFNGLKGFEVLPAIGRWGIFLLFDTVLAIIYSRCRGGPCGRRQFLRLL